MDSKELQNTENLVNPENPETPEKPEKPETPEKPEESIVLRSEGLIKRYGKRTVVNDVSFNVRQGEIVGLLGPNGAGKTTSFYMTTGLVLPNGGHIYLGDREVTDFPVYKRARAGIGYLAQEPSVFRKMSVEDNILSVLEMTGKPRDYQLQKLESLIAEFRLEKVRKNKGDQLSGGERRRTEIARCLAIEPKFIMLDEPFAGVDPIAVEDIQQIVWKLKYRNIGILITDHNVDETLAITDRAYLLFEGRILFQGTPEELATNPIVREKYLTESFELRKKQFQNDSEAELKSAAKTEPAAAPAAKADSATAPAAKAEPATAPADSAAEGTHSVEDGENRDAHVSEDSHPHRSEANDGEQ